MCMYIYPSIYLHIYIYCSIIYMYIVHLDARTDGLPNPRIELQLPTETRPVGSLAGATRPPYLSIYLSLSLSIHIHVCVRVSVYMNTCICIYIYIYTYIHIYIHIHIHHIYIYCSIIYMYIVYLDARLDDLPNPRIELQLPTETRPVGSLAGDMYIYIYCSIYICILFTWTRVRMACQIQESTCSCQHPKRETRLVLSLYLSISLSTFTSLYIYLCIYKYKYTYTSIYICVYMCIYVYLSIYLSTHLYLLFHYIYVYCLPGRAFGWLSKSKNRIAATNRDSPSRLTRWRDAHPLGAHPESLAECQVDWPAKSNRGIVCCQIAPHAPWLRLAR